MYKIRNNSDGKVIIGDLNIIFAYREEKDLDLLFSRETIEKSDNLRKAFVQHGKSPAKLVLVEDRPAYVTPSPQAHVEVIHTSPALDSEALEAMEARIRKQMADHMAQLLAQQNPQKSSPDDLGAKMDAILKALHSGSTPKVSSDDETFEDDEKMLDIHKKVVERLTRGTAQIQSSKSESKDTGVDKKANELEDLI